MWMDSRSYSRLYSRHIVHLTEVSVGSLGQVQGAQLASRSADDSVSKREPETDTTTRADKTATGLRELQRANLLDLRVMELESGRALAVGVGDSGGSDDLDGLVAGTVSAGHVVVQVVDGGVQGHVSVLTVHIVGAAARVVLHPDTEVLHGCAVLLGDLVDVEDLTGGLLHLSHLMHEVPESGLGHHLVGGEDLHSVSRRIFLGLGGGLSAHHLVQSHLQEQHSSRGQLGAGHSIRTSKNEGMPLSAFVTNTER